MKISVKVTIGYFWAQAKKYKFSFSLALISQAIVVAMGFMLIPIFIKDLIDLMSNYQEGDRLLLQSELLWIFLIIVGIEVIAFWLFGRIFDFATVYFEANAKRDLEYMCFEKIQSHSFVFFANNFVGSLVSKVKRFSQAFERIADIILFHAVSNIIIYSVSIIIISYYALWMGILLGIWMIFYFIIIYWISLKWKIPKDRQNAKMDSKMTGSLADAITNVPNIKIFANLDYEKKNFFGVLTALFQARMSSWTASNYLNIFQSVMTSIMSLGSLFFVIKLWLNGEITIGTIVLIQAYLAHIYGSLWEMGRILRDFYTALIDAEEMVMILELPIAIQDPLRSQVSRIKHGTIEFKNVKFGYETNNNFFDDFNLHIAAGKKIGIVGESGAGKTTITKLLLRFSDIRNGDIQVDQQSIYEITQNDLRSNIAFVPQESILFHRSLFDNIQYGRIKASKKEVYEAAKNAHAHEFIVNSPKGYDTFVGERGVKLSGGERQRIAIARAMLKNAPILILDEATSALDSKAESLIQDALANLMKNRTTLVIAHRLSTLRMMDEILVFDRGCIVERGSHFALLRKKGKYAELWSHQAGGFLSE